MRTNTQILLASMFHDVESDFNNRELPAVHGHLLFMSSSPFAVGHFLAAYANDTSGIFKKIF